jgi:hypothetical protein
MHMTMERGKVPALGWTILMLERPSLGRVLNNYNRTARTIVFALYKEVVSQYPGMAFYKGMLTKGEVSRVIRKVKQN